MKEKFAIVPFVAKSEMVISYFSYFVVLMILLNINETRFLFE